METQKFLKRSVTRRVSEGAFFVCVWLYAEGLADVYVRVRHTATDEALHMHLESRNMERVNRFACVCVRLSARGSGEPCAMEENERVA